MRMFIIFILPIQPLRSTIGYEISLIKKSAFEPGRKTWVFQDWILPSLDLFNPIVNILEAENEK